MSDAPKNDIAVRQSSDAPIAVFGSVSGFESAVRMAKPLADSDLVPDTYRGKIQNVLVAMEMSQRTGAGIMAVMQNLHIIQGRPSWSSSFIIAALNSCGRFSPIRFRVEDLGDKEIPYEYWDGPKGQRKKMNGRVKIRDRRWVAYCRDIDTGDELEGPEVTLEMAVLEGWYTKNDSKWKTMTDLMGRYRSAAFFGRLYAPDVLMGMHDTDELADIEAVREPRDVTPPRADAGGDPLAASVKARQAAPEPEKATEAKPDPAPRRGARRKPEPAAAAEPEIEDAEIIEAEKPDPEPSKPAAEPKPADDAPVIDDAPPADDDAFPETDDGEGGDTKFF